MQIATLTTTGQIVEIIVVRGGWTTIRANGVESKVRNGQLTNHGDSHEEFEELTTTEELFEEPAVEVVRVIEPTEVDIDVRKNGSVDPLYLNKYRKTVMNVNGKKKTAVDCDDRIAQRLRGLPLHIVYMEAANLLDTSVRTLTEQYQHLNPGMQRMNLSNRMRKAQRELDKQAAALGMAVAKAGVTLKDNQGRTCELFINPESIQELMDTGMSQSEAEEGVTNNAFEVAVRAGEIGKDAWIA